MVQEVCAPVIIAELGTRASVHAWRRVTIVPLVVCAHLHKHQVPRVTGGTVQCQRCNGFEGASYLRSLLAAGNGLGEGGCAPGTGRTGA